MILRRGVFVPPSPSWQIFGIVPSAYTHPIVRLNHQTFQVPKMEVLTYISCMQGLCKGKPTPEIA